MTVTTTTSPSSKPNNTMFIPEITLPQTPSTTPDLIQNLAIQIGYVSPFCLSLPASNPTSNSTTWNNILQSTTTNNILPSIINAVPLSRVYLQISHASDLAITTDLLNLGIGKLVIPYSVIKDSGNAWKSIPTERIIITCPDNEEALKTVTEWNVPFLVVVTSGEISAKYGADSPYYRGIVLHGQPAVMLMDLEWVSEMAAKQSSIMIPSTMMTFNGQRLDLSKDNSDDNITPVDFLDVFWNSLSPSDRSDGLIATIVVDESKTSLGLVYSSQKSLRESIRTNAGVYQSRKRGLWYKGATSGATQELIRVDVDCDRDALQFVVKQTPPGFCHFNTHSCFGEEEGLQKLVSTLETRMKSAPEGSYTKRLFNDEALLSSKIVEEAKELVEASSRQDIIWEASDVIYFALVKCVKNGVSLADIGRELEKRSLKVTRRGGDAKEPLPAESDIKKEEPKKQSLTPAKRLAPANRIELDEYQLSELTTSTRKTLLRRPIINSSEILKRVQPIIDDVRQRGDAALLDLTKKFDRVSLPNPTLQAPFPAEMMKLDPAVQKAIDQAYANIQKFHEAQLSTSELRVETMPGIVCSRFVRPIESVGLYIPGGSAILPSTALMLGIPAKVAGVKNIVFATPPRADGTPCPEMVYVAHKVGAKQILLAGGAQAVATMAYGTESVTKVDKICGPGNQYVTAAKMIVQNDSSALVSIDMPAGPSEVLVIADSTSNPKYVASDLLSQAEHGPDSQVVLLTINLPRAQIQKIQTQVHEQANALPRVDIIRESISKSYLLNCKNIDEALAFSNEYAPEHLILNLKNAAKYVEKVENAGSVFVGEYSPESCGDYASGTNHTLPTYGFAKMYSGVNTHTFVKHITSQELTREGLRGIAETVMTLASVEGLDAHRRAVEVRMSN